MPINGIYTPLEYNQAKKAISYIDTKYKEHISAHGLAEEFRMDIKTLRIVVQAITGESIHNYLLKVRLDKATQDLLDFKLSIASIATRNGFSHSHHFSRLFKARYGVTPRKYREEISRKENHL
ncbi:AraC family transcriptional regulator [Chitinophaga sp. CC14]|uniref:helix-turn-helix transcriptional regulator n=1 Tax=Chitinophaga sp. CC14 TaxID=3029199 RepID=UPI003B7930AA